MSMTSIKCKGEHTVVAATVGGRPNREMWGPKFVLDWPALAAALTTAYNYSSSFSTSLSCTLDFFPFFSFFSSLRIFRGSALIHFPIPVCAASRLLLFPSALVSTRILAWLHSLIPLFITLIALISLLERFVFLLLVMELF